MKDIIKSLDLKNMQTKGRVCIDFTDPVTGKVKERIQGENHVFNDGVFSGTGFDWISSVSDAWLVLNTNTAQINTEFPYVMGQTVGYGIPTYGTSGIRGAYNADKSILARMSTSGIDWKFVYNFHTDQVNDIQIGTVALTHQYKAAQKKHILGYRQAVSGSCYNTNDGRYNYACSKEGIVTRYDMWLGTESCPDITSVVGSNSNYYKFVAYAPLEGKYYVICYKSNGDSGNKVYEFSSNDFSTCTNEYLASDMSLPATSAIPIYVYGGCLYIPYNDYISKVDFINKKAAERITLNECSSAALNESSSAKINGLRGCTTAYNKYIICTSSGSPYYTGCIFDMSTDSASGYIHHPIYEADPIMFNPITESKVVSLNNGSGLYNNAALTSYLLDEPFTKGSDRAMTVTYELVVEW